jgi:hypothetical protein
MRQRTIRRAGAFVALSGLLLTLGAAAAGAARAGEVCVQPAGAVVADRVATCPGTLRIEKRAGSVEGELLPGAAFAVDCTSLDEAPAPVVTGLYGDGVATTGVFTIVGSAGSECVVTEVAAPEGYDLAGDPARTLTIPEAGGTTTEIFVNAVTVEPTEEPTEEPTSEPTGDPVVEPGDPDPTISPTVLGVKVVRPAPQLPSTGASTGLLAAALLGLVLVCAGSGLVLHAHAAARRH